MEWTSEQPSEPSKDCEVGKEKEEMVIEDQDFRAEFDGRAWTVDWYWKESHQS